MSSATSLPALFSTSSAWSSLRGSSRPLVSPLQSLNRLPSSQVSLWLEDLWIQHPTLFPDLTLSDRSRTLSSRGPRLGRPLARPQCPDQLWRAAPDRSRAPPPPLGGRTHPPTGWPASHQASSSCYSETQHRLTNMTSSSCVKLIVSQARAFCWTAPEVTILTPWIISTHTQYCLHNMYM